MTPLFFAKPAPRREYLVLSDYRSLTMGLFDSDCEDTPLLPPNSLQHADGFAQVRTLSSRGQVAPIMLSQKDRSASITVCHTRTRNTFADSDASTPPYAGLLHTRTPMRHRPTSLSLLHATPHDTANDARGCRAAGQARAEAPGGGERKDGEHRVKYVLQETTTEHRARRWTAKFWTSSTPSPPLSYFIHVDAPCIYMCVCLPASMLACLRV